MKEKLIAKIKALLNRTVENGASLNEAEIALKKQTNLLQSITLQSLNLKTSHKKKNVKRLK